MVELIYIKYFLFFLMGFFAGRIAMAIQYAFFKEMPHHKKESLNDKLKDKINKISLKEFDT